MCGGRWTGGRGWPPSGLGSRKGGGAGALGSGLDPPFQRENGGRRFTGAALMARGTLSPNIPSAPGGADCAVTSFLRRTLPHSARAGPVSGPGPEGPLTEFQEPALAVRVEEGVREVVAIVFRDFKGLVFYALVQILG